MKKNTQDKEYWSSRLHKHGELPGKYTKKLTHKKERREATFLTKEMYEGLIQGYRVK